MPPKTVPDKLPGTVQPQYNRCGKPNCKCAHGELHGPYWYRFWRKWDGKQHKQYVSKPDVEPVRAASEAQQQELREAQAVLARGRKAVESCARYKAGIRSRYSNPGELIADLFEPLRVGQELVKLAQSQKGGIMVQVEAFRIFLMLAGCLRQPGDKPNEHRPPPGAEHYWANGGSGRETGSSGSSTTAKNLSENLIKVKTDTLEGQNRRALTRRRGRRHRTLAATVNAPPKGPESYVMSSLPTIER